MAWACLFVAGLFEIAWAVTLKFTDGFTKPWPSAATIVLMIASFGLLSMAYQRIPVGTAYAVWTGVGAAGTALMGILLFGESASAPRLVCLAAVAAGVVGLKAAS